MRFTSQCSDPLSTELPKRLSHSERPPCSRDIAERSNAFARRKVLEAMLRHLSWVRRNLYPHRQQIPAPHGRAGGDAAAAATPKDQPFH